MKNKMTMLTIAFLILFLANCKSLTSLPIEKEKEKYTIIHQSKGDLNFDGIPDLAILASNNVDEKGTIIVFIADSKGNVSKKLVNEHLTDVFIEMYNGLPEIEIKNGELIISYYGGMCHRESRNLIFSFNIQLNDLFFKTIEMGTHNVCNDEEPSGYEITNAELRRVTFTEYKDEL